MEHQLTPTSSGSHETLEHFFEELLRRNAASNGGKEIGLRDWVDLAETWRITHALRRCRGNRSAAARMLGIGRRTLYSKMDKLGIEPTFSPWNGR
jgi:DNA-binding NtrC family response regulator